MTAYEKASAHFLDRYNVHLQAERNRATGPKTEAGKQRSRLNAYKHGLTGQIHLFTAEEHEAFEKHCQSIVDALAPVGPLEQQLAQSIAENRWRLNRAAAIESGIFALGQTEAAPAEADQALSQAKAWLADSKNIQLLTLYEQRIQRSLRNSTADLRVLQAERLAARRQAVEEELLLSQLAESKGETYKIPAEIQSGQFVFSSSEIEPLIARQKLLDEARALPKVRIAPKPARQTQAAA
jgi:hypothetical protein